MAASTAAQVAATPAGVKRTRLATGTSLGAEAGAWTRASSCRAVVGWVVGGRVAVASDRVIVKLPVSL